MRDQYDAQMWNDHHHQFSEWAGTLAGAAGAALRRSGSAAARTPPQLLAALAAVGLTLLTFGASAIS